MQSFFYAFLIQKSMKSIDGYHELCYTESSEVIRLIQIYMYKKNFDVQKAERFFKERRITVQVVDLARKPPSKREVQLFMQRLGNPGMFDTDGKLYQGHLVRFTSDTDTIIEKAMAEPQLLKTPIVRSGQLVTNGYQPDVWEKWIADGKV